MSNFIGRIGIEMEKKIFSFLLIFLIIFLGIDLVTIIMNQISGFLVIIWYLIPLIISLIIAGVIIDKVGKRSIFLLFLIPEGLLTLVLGFNVTNPTALAILWIFIGILSGFTITSLLGFFVDTTNIEHRGKIAGIVSGVAWLVAAVVLSYSVSAIFAANILMFAFAVIKLIGGGIAFYLLFAKIEEKKDIIKHQATSQGFVSYLKESYRFLWADKKYIIYLIAFVLIWVAQGIFMPIGGSGQAPPQNYQQITSIGFAAGGIILILSGFLIDEKGRKEILVYGAILVSISFISYYFPLGAVFLSGIPVLFTCIIVFLGDIAPSDAKTRYYSVFLLFNFLAFFIGYIIGIIITPSQWVALACIIISALALLLIFLKGAKSPEPTDLAFKERITSTTITSPDSAPSDKVPSQPTFSD
jgi:MFS family permease